MLGDGWRCARPARGTHHHGVGPVVERDGFGEEFGAVVQPPVTPELALIRVELDFIPERGS